MGKRGSGSVGLLAAVVEELRAATAVRDVAGRRAGDAAAMALAVAIVALTLSASGRNIFGTPFLLALPVWIVARTRGVVAGAAGAALLIAVTWVSWYDAHLLARVNVTIIIALALLAGLDGRRHAAGRAAPAGAREPVERPPSMLTRREQDVLALLATGHTNKEVAAQLGLSVRTIESHRARIVMKLGSSGRADLYRHALEFGLLEPEPVPG